MNQETRDPEIGSLVGVIGLQESFVFDNLVDVLNR